MRQGVEFNQANCEEGVRWLVAAEIIEALLALGVVAGFAPSETLGKRSICLVVERGEDAMHVGFGGANDVADMIEVSNMAARVANPWRATLTPLDSRIRTFPAETCRRSGLTLFANGLCFATKEAGRLALDGAFARETGRWRAKGARGSHLLSKVSEGLGRWLSEQGRAQPPMLVSIAAAALGGGSQSPFWLRPVRDLDFGIGLEPALLMGAELCGFAVDGCDVEQLVMQGEEDVHDAALRIVGMLESEGGPEADFFLVANAIQRAMGNFID